MRAFIALFLCVCFVATVSAQQTKRSFIGKQELSWLDSEVQVFETNLTKLDRAHLKSEDVDQTSGFKSRTITSINRLSANTTIILKSIQDFIDVDFEETSQERRSDEPRNLSYKRMIKKDNVEHIMLFDADLKRLHDYASDISKIQKALSDNQFDFYVAEDKTASNLELSKKLLNLVKEFNSILQKSKV